MLNPLQKTQIDKQIHAYENQDKTTIVDIVIGGKTIKLEVNRLVANPHIMNSGIQTIKYIIQNQDLIKNKIVTDMGTGCGIIGIVSCLLGAKKVIMSDIDKKAVANAKKNIQKYKLNEVCNVFESDLFNNYENEPKSDTQIFNHPFFAVEPIPGKNWTRMMLGGTDLIGRYLEQAPNYSTPNAKYIFPWFTLANNEQNDLDNDPAKRAPEYGYRIVKITEQKPIKQGIQQEKFKIYELEHD